MSTKLKLMGVDVASSATRTAARRAAARYQFIDERKQVYKKLVVSDDGKHLLGGDAGRRRRRLRHAAADDAERHRRCPSVPEFLILPQRDGKAKPGLGVDALPDARRSARATTSRKGAICDGDRRRLRHASARSRRCTKAGTGCGGCVPLVTQVLKAELKKRGLAVNNHLCEHFAYSRQELFHLVARRPDQDLRRRCSHKHGKGLGCDICKPAAASILASCWNEFVLKPEHASAAGHQRPLPRQHPEGRHLLGRAAHAGRRDHARQADRARRRSPRSTASTPRSPAASASTCSARASSSCRRSGRS